MNAHFGTAADETSESPSLEKTLQKHLAEASRALSDEIAAVKALESRLRRNEMAGITDVPSHDSDPQALQFTRDIERRVTAELEVVRVESSIAASKQAEASFNADRIKILEQLQLQHQRSVDAFPSWYSNMSTSLSMQQSTAQSLQTTEALQDLASTRLSAQRSLAERLASSAVVAQQLRFRQDLTSDPLGESQEEAALTAAIAAAKTVFDELGAYAHTELAPAAAARSFDTVCCGAQTDSLDVVSQRSFDSKEHVEALAWESALTAIDVEIAKLQGRITDLEEQGIAP
eukprot:TRINITY_DN14020_c0_g1_i1.p2 TRINITY_DN14020_c0_g1~~TRINITY_DN14020_c0_g1_i1.p2  ORF type:complete len:289 (-),score=73.51 TRINITY_DN14020_c0_g1_i1:1089-1955(-)